MSEYELRYVRLVRTCPENRHSDLHLHFGENGFSQLKQRLRFYAWTWDPSMLKHVIFWRNMAPGESLNIKLGDYYYEELFYLTPIDKHVLFVLKRTVVSVE